MSLIILILGGTFNFLGALGVKKKLLITLASLFNAIIFETPRTPRKFKGPPREI